MTPRFAGRIERAQKAMATAELDVLVVTNRENLIYFTGATQIECLALLIPKQDEACAVALWLDADYVRELSGLTTHAYFFPRQTLGTAICEKIRSFGYKDPRIGFERYFVDFAVYDALRSTFCERNFVGAGDLFYRLRSVKEPQELDLIRRASEAVCKGMDAAMKAVRPGTAELDVLAEAEYSMLRAGSGGSSFRPQVVSGDRTLLAHPTASSRKIREGEVVVVHLGATFEGYCSKMARTAAVGVVPKEQADVHALLLRALERAEAALRPGATSGEVDAAAREVVEQAGFGKSYLESVGYGVGLRQSEFYPIIGRGRTEIIEIGMVIDLLLPTIYRKGIGGPRITDVIHVGEAENQLLTDYPRDLVRI
ncbi:MAG: M24 family metallopeptidase [Syntrophobacteraceae bacterium]